MSEYKKELTELVRIGIADLNNFFEKIEKSPKLKKFINDKDALTDIYFNIIASFTISKLVGHAHTATIIMDKTGKKLSRKERAQFMISKYKYVFDFMIKQFAEKGAL